MLHESLDHWDRQTVNTDSSEYAMELLSKRNDPSFLQGMMVKAISKRHIVVIQKIHELNKSIAIDPSNLESVIHNTSYNPSTSLSDVVHSDDILRFLIENKADVNYQYTNRRMSPGQPEFNTMNTTSLHVAAASGSTSSVAMLLAAGANIDVLDEKQQNPIVRAYGFLNANTQYHDAEFKAKTDNMIQKNIATLIAHKSLSGHLISDQELGCLKQLNFEHFKTALEHLVRESWSCNLDKAPEYFRKMNESTATLAEQDFIPLISNEAIRMLEFLNQHYNPSMGL